MRKLKKRCKIFYKTYNGVNFTKGHLDKFICKKHKYSIHKKLNMKQVRVYTSKNAGLFRLKDLCNGNGIEASPLETHKNFFLL